MSVQQLLTIIGVLSVIIAMTAVARGRSADAPARPGRALAPSLAIVALALLAVGLVSHTFLRHVVQILPIVAALILVTRGSTSGVSAAASVLAFWLLLMGVIWLFLLDIARLIRGSFTPAEIALTIVVGAAAALGLRAAALGGTNAPAVRRFATIAAFALFQFAAMWASFLPVIDRR